jgi:MoCo/4Fe-4S cofactor protein with predicted Tat translocation signal
MSNRLAKTLSLPLFPSPLGETPVVAMKEQSDPSAAFEALRTRAASQHGQQYWRSLQELAETPEFEGYIQREFPHEAGEWHDPTSRRTFMKLMGASLAFAGVGLTAGCEQNEEKIVPYVDPPENIIPGKPLFYATTMPFRSGQGIGLLVEQHMGRPTKIEGNPEHPASLGATDAMAQASVLSLYDPDRSGAVKERAAITTWSQFSRQVESTLYDAGAALTNKRIRILTETVCSPTLGNEIQALLKRFPQARWHQYEPINRDNVNAAFASFGPPTNTYYDFSKAERILSLDCNFLHDEPGSIRYARQYIDGRRVRVAEHEGHKTLHRETAAKRGSEMTEVDGGFGINRLYVAESTPTITGASADHRVAVKPSQVYDIAVAVARAVGVSSVGEAPALSAALGQWVEAVAEDLRSHAGKSLIIAGAHQPPAVHVLAHAMNAALQSVGQTVFYTDPVEAEAQADSGAGAKAKSTQIESLAALVADLNAGNVDMLLILGGNPVYTAPADLDFAGALKKFVDIKVQDDTTGRQRYKNFAIHLSQYFDETSIRCHWHLPESQYLESWGDLRAFDGTVSLQQPLISPLYGTRSAVEVVAGIMLNRDAKGYDLVRTFWQSETKLAGDAFEQMWNKSLHDGIVAGSALRTRPANLRADLAAITARPAVPTAADATEIVFRPDPNIWDGRWANNGWLMELPKPLTKITWDNVILMSPKTASEKFGIRHDNVDDRRVAIVTLRRDGRDVTGPVWISFGHPDDSVTVHLGFGRTRAGRVGGTEGETHGFDAYAIRTSGAATIAADVMIGKDERGKQFEIACTQHHQLIDFSHPSMKDAGGPYAHEDLNKQRQLVKTLDYDTFKDAHGDHGHHPKHISLYPQYPYDSNGLHKWGMVIDQNACIGCNACVTACQSENNIAVVGKQQVIMQREMHWLRIDTYYTGDPIAPSMMFQPMMCQHCETAPCEVVCPVAATSHSDEGINEMTYNRCVGTRYCSNNCPYKVRRFNFLQYNDNRIASLKLMRNPDVTVRNRGVMEKCTFCVQRVNLTRIELKKLEVEASEGAASDPDASDRIHEKYAGVLSELQTACQQVCPTEAIIFGDLNYTKKAKAAKGPLQVERLKHQPREVHYDLLGELNTRPRTTYLARFRNYNPAIAAAGAPAAKPHA